MSQKLSEINKRLTDRNVPVKEFITRTEYIIKLDNGATVIHDIRVDDSGIKEVTRISGKDECVAEVKEILEV